MKPAFDQLLKNYDKHNFWLFQKAKVIVTICFTILALLPMLMFYTFFIAKTISPVILLPEIGAFLIVSGAFYLLLKGHFSINILEIKPVMLIWI